MRIETNALKSNGTTEVELVAAPGHMLQREVVSVRAFNRDNMNATLFFYLNLGGTQYFLRQTLLTPNAQLEWLSKDNLVALTAHNMSFTASLTAPVTTTELDLVVTYIDGGN